MPKAHHATVTRTRLFACEPVYNEREQGWQLHHTTADGHLLITRDVYNTAKDAVALLQDADPEDDEWVGGIEWLQPGFDGDEEDDEFNANKCGVMDSRKHDEYEHNPHGPGCNDGIDIALRDAYTGENGVDLVALKACAGFLWNPAWENLNPGMQRMNTANKLRGYLRNNERATITIGAKTGRFGVSYNPSKRNVRKAKA